MSEPPAASWQRRPRKSPTHDPPFDPPLPPRFSLLTLFGVVTATAVYCGLLRLFRVYAVVLLFMLLFGLLVRPFAILGFAPWFTFNAYLSNSQRTRYAITGGRTNRWGFIIGFALVVALPFVVEQAVNAITPGAKALWPVGPEDDFTG